MVFARTEPCLVDLAVRLFFPGNEPLAMGMDETIERRRGRTMAARSLSRCGAVEEGVRGANPWRALDGPRRNRRDRKAVGHVFESQMEILVVNA